MFRKLFLCLTLSLCASVGMAQDGEWDSSWVSTAPDKYIEANTQTIISPTSACNTGGEAFKDFIPRFRKDVQFRNQRVRFNSEMDSFCFGAFENFQLIKASHKKTRCLNEFGTWYDVSADTVCFMFSETPLCDEEWGGSNFAFRFQRIDGLWYCTGVMLAG